MSDIATGFPKNLAYNLKRLQAGFTKTKVKILPDKTSVSANDTLRFLLPRGTIIDFRSLCLFFTGATAGTGSTATYFHFPRYSSSLIQNISVTANNITLCSINEYGFLFNALMDIEGGDISQTSKRFGEMFDPTIKYSSTASTAGDATTYENAISASRYISTADTGANDTNVKMCINNFLGFLNSLSTPCIDLYDIGDVWVNIQFAPATVLYHSSMTATAPTLSGVNYTLTDIFMTVDKIVFQSADYYQLKNEQLLGDGLKVAYYDYWLSTGSAVAKSAGINHNFSVNSASLDQLIATFRRTDYNQNKPLIMYGGNSLVANNAANTISLDQYNANPVAYTNASSDQLVAVTRNLGDGFANSIAFVRSGNDLLGSQWSVNNVAIDQYPLVPLEIFQKDLQYTGFQNLDLGSSGCHVGIKSIHHFLKYYFVDICSLENISGDNQMWVSGLDGRNGGILVNYSATFASTNAQTVNPYVYCRSTKVLSIKAGRQLEIDAPPK